MQKVIKRISFFSFIISAIIFALMFYAQISIPDEINLSDSGGIMSGAIFTYKIKNSDHENESKSDLASGYELSVSLFDTIPVKKTKLTVKSRKYVSISGDVFGIKMYTDGVMVVANEQIESGGKEVSPGESAGIKPGDIVKMVNSKKVLSSSALSKIVSDSKGQEVSITFLRNGVENTVKIKPVISDLDGRYKIGLWVRDSTAGIGTMTFFDRDNGMFGGLGHAVCDIDTGLEMPISDGDAVKATINGVYKGKIGTPGELIGVFDSGSIGKLYYNGNTGIYGILSVYDKNSPVVPVALSQEVSTGKAQILSTVDDSGPKYYDIEIERVYKSNNNVKNMIIKVTDDKLMSLTGGIVQGMSGTPIIQNNMLVGAITHVFINDPSHGYAIFAENMIVTAQEVYENVMKKAS